MEDALISLVTGKDVALARPANRPLLLVIAGPYAAAQAMLALAAHLAQRGPLQVLDGGNRFNAYIVARQLRRLSAAVGPGTDRGQSRTDVRGLRQCLGRIRVARAFTCYQMTALIDQSSLNGSPTLVIDLLDTFYDESAPLAERRRLAEHCMQRLRQSIQPPPASSTASGPVLAQPGQVVVISLRPPPPGKTDPTGLQELVQAAADQVLFQAGTEPEPSAQLKLF